MALRREPGSRLRAREGRQPRRLSSATREPEDSFGTLCALGGVAERSNAAVSKTVTGGSVGRGFKSLPLRSSLDHALRARSRSRFTTVRVRHVVGGYWLRERRGLVPPRLRRGRSRAPRAVRHADRHQTACRNRSRHHARRDRLLRRSGGLARRLAQLERVARRRCVPLRRGAEPVCPLPTDPTFSTDIEAVVALVEGASREHDPFRELALELSSRHRANNGRIMSLQWIFRAGAIALLVEVLFWILFLAQA